MTNSVVNGVIESEFDHHVSIRLPTLNKTIQIARSALVETGQGLRLRSDAKVEHEIPTRNEPAKELCIPIPEAVLAQLKP